MTRIALLALGVLLAAVAAPRHEVATPPAPVCGVTAGYDGCRP